VPATSPGPMGPSQRRDQGGLACPVGSQKKRDPMAGFERHILKDRGPPPVPERQAIDPQ
jgi:hypothetical protein